MKQLSYILFLIALGCFIAAQVNSGFNKKHPKPNSLVYLLDADSNSAIWATYDALLDDWTKPFLTDQPNVATDNMDETFSSKYRNGFTFTKQADIKSLSLPNIDIQKDTIIDDTRHVSLLISLQRSVNRFEFFSDTATVFNAFSVNGFDLDPKSAKVSVFPNRTSNSLFDFYVTNEASLALKFSVPKNQKTELRIYEASYDLLGNPLFDVPKRPDIMIPKPFVLNDAIIIKKTISFE